jgi:hypothetical protein
MKTTPASEARARAGFTVQSAAKALGFANARSWRRIELHGGATMKIAERAGRLFGCDGSLFFYPPCYHAAVESGAQARSTCNNTGNHVLSLVTGGADTNTTTRSTQRCVRAIRRRSSQNSVE